MYTKSGRSLWPVLVGALVVLVVVLGSLLVVAVMRDDREGPTPAVPSLMPTPMPMTEPREGQPGEDHGAELGDPPTGCIAGPGRGADAVLTTQVKAPHTAYGAVEMAASYMRWANGYPMADAAQVELVQEDVMSSDAESSVKDLTAAFAAAAAAESMKPAGQPYGTPFTVSTRNGQWLVDPTSTDDKVTVHLSLGVVVDGALSADAYGIGSPVFAWEAGHGWQLVDMIPTDTAALEAGGTAFIGGC